MFKINHFQLVLTNYRLRTTHHIKCSESIICCDQWIRKMYHMTNFREDFFFCSEVIINIYYNNKGLCFFFQCEICNFLVDETSV